MVANDTTTWQAAVTFWLTSVAANSSIPQRAEVAKKNTRASLSSSRRRGDLLAFTKKKMAADAASTTRPLFLRFRKLAYQNFHIARGLSDQVRATNKTNVATKAGALLEPAIAAAPENQ